MKIWLKTILEEKVTRSVLFECADSYDEDSVFSALRSACNDLDIPTPLFSRTNYFNFVTFNSVRLKSCDFVESVDFDQMELEIVIEK